MYELIVGYWPVIATCYALSTIFFLIIHKFKINTDMVVDIIIAGLIFSIGSILMYKYYNVYIALQGLIFLGFLVGFFKVNKKNKKSN